MEEFRQKLIEELVWIIGPAIVLAVILIVAFCLTPRFLADMELGRSKWIVYIIMAALFLLNVVWTYSDASKIILDLEKNAFVTYTGEIDYLSRKSTKVTDVFQLIDSPDGTVVEAYSGIIEATIQKCYGRIIYAENSKIVLEFEVHEVRETRDPIVVLP